MKNGRLLTVIVLILAFTLVAILPGAAMAKKWKAGGVAAANTLDDDTLKLWCKLVKDKTGGKLVVDEFPGEQLGPYRDMFDNVVRGTQESGLLPLSPEFDKRLQAGYTIYLAQTCGTRGARFTLPTAGCSSCWSRFSWSWASSRWDSTSWAWTVSARPRDRW